MANSTDPTIEPMNDRDASRGPGRSVSTSGNSAPKRVTFDDFQIQRSEQQKQVEEEKKVWAERLQREEEQKSGFLKFAAPRLRKLSDEMIGGRNKFTSFLFGGGKPASIESEEEVPEADVTQQPYFAEHEKLVVRVTKKTDPASSQPGTMTFRNPNASNEKRNIELNDLPAADFRRHAQLNDEENARDIHEGSSEEYSDTEYEEEIDDAELIQQFNEKHEIDVANGSDDDDEDEDERYDEDEEDENEEDDYDDEEEYEEESGPELSSQEVVDEYDGEDPLEEGATEEGQEIREHNAPQAQSEYETFYEQEDEEVVEYAESVTYAEASAYTSAEQAKTYSPDAPQASYVSPLKDEPGIDPALKSYLDVLTGFDSMPRRANEPRDPRADFVTLLAEQLDILREQVGAMSSLFFWVNNRKQQLVLECGALDDTAHMYLSKEKKFPIEYDAVSMVVTKKKPELHSSIAPQAEADLIPYYVESIGIASFAAMPVVFGDGIVGVITVDSLEEDSFNAETLRLLTSHSKLIAGLIRSYIEKYDLMASARTLEAARKLYQIVSPDSSLRVLKDQRRSPEWILRALTEAASEIVDWEWLATVSFDDARRAWSINSLQSKHTKPYLLPKTPISMNESLIGKCLSTGRSSRNDSLPPSSIRFTLEEDTQTAQGHSFLGIPIRTTNKNYGVLAIEHSERNRFTDADVETLEHLARSAAAALEITALSDIVEERALTDLLTGVFNKRGLTLRLNEELARAMEFDEPLTLVIFEVDGAGEFMSRFTQEDIDTITLGVTRLLRYGARPFDVIARIGENAFAALLVRMSDEEGYLWSEKMRKMIVSEVIAIGKRSFSVTVSIGVAGARRDGTTEELIEGAELALERAKELGGNNVIVY